MNQYAISCLIASLACLFLGAFIYLKNIKRSLNILWALFELSIAIWVFSQFIESTTQNEEIALFWNKILLCGVTFIPIFFLHFVTVFLNVKHRKIIVTSYSIGLLFLVLNFTPFMIKGVTFKPSLGYYTSPGTAYYFLFVFFGLCVIYAFYLIARHFKTLIAIKQGQLKYITVGSVIGFACGFGNFLPTFNLPAFPIINYIFILSQIPLMYAILEYRFMDIRLFITRAGIFIFVYSFIFALPILIGLKTQAWLWSTVLMGILSPIGIFVYSYLRERAEKFILKEQASYQTVLKELAKTMTQIRALDDLLNIIILRIFAAIQPHFIAFYIFSKDDKKYILKHNRIQDAVNLEKEIPIDSTLVDYLEERHRSILVEEASFFKFPLETVAIPCFIQNGLFAFIILGPKPKKELYTSSDFVIFDIVSSEASLAIENCLFWQEEKTRLAKEEQIRRQRAMDHFSASLAHEIDNPIFAVTGITEVVKMTVTADLKDCIPQDKLNFLSDRLSRITKDLFRISKMIRAIREFSSQTKGEQVILKLDDILDDFLSIVEPEFKYEGIFFEKQIEQDISLKGNKIHLEEVFINLSTNAIHAVKHNGQKEKRITFKVSKNTPKTFLIELSDNGYGIKKEMLEDIFLDFVTTKASTEGTGMGLGRVRKIVEDHGGKIWASSKGAGTGAIFSIELPFI